MVLLYLSVFATGCWLLCRSFLHFTQDFREPPAIPHVIPYFGHLTGLLRHGTNYFIAIRARYGAPNYTLRLPGTRIYIISSPKVVAAVDRHSSTLSLDPFALDFIKRTTMLSKEGFDIMQSESYIDKKGQSAHSDIVRAMGSAIVPGTALDHTTSKVLSSALRFMESPTSEEIDLFAWTRRLLTRVSTDALYGAERNPLRDPAVEYGLWAVKEDLLGLGLNRLSKVICPKGYRGRQLVFDAFKKYYQDNGHQGASSMIQIRYKSMRRYGLCEEDIAHFDLNVCLGLLINTVPAACWTLYYVYSQPALLDEVRTAISSYLKSTAEGPSHHVNIADIVSACPLIPSIVHETLRLQSVSSSVRKVLEDTVVNGQYLLKKGSTVLIPSAQVHKTNSLWGTSSRNFDPRRFCSDGVFEPKKPTSVYRAFGGGSFLCPGRFLAVNEIMIVLVVMVCKYNLEPLADSSWEWPQTQSSLTSAMLSPRKEIRVNMQERKGFESVNWRFEWRSKTDA